MSGPLGVDRRLDQMGYRASALAEAGRYEEAFRLFRYLAGRDDDLGLTRLANCYDVGEGVRRSPKKALWLIA